MIADRLSILRFGLLSAVPGVAHGITSRAGGVSTARFSSLNVSYTVGDDPANVEENLRRVGLELGVQREHLFSAYQVHGTQAIVVDDLTPPRPRSDILLTQSRERALLLRFADCTPVLIADARHRAVAAVHAGWRGSAARAAGAGVRAMQSAFGSRPTDLVAGIGPAIGPCCYVVGQDVVDAFGDRGELFVDGKLDLWAANRDALVEAGVPHDQIEVSGVCTRCESERFFSHRANGGLPAGRFAAVIRLE